MHDPYTLDLEVVSSLSTTKLLDNPSFKKLKREMRQIEEKFKRKSSFSSHDPNSGQKPNELDFSPF